MASSDELLTLSIPEQLVSRSLNPRRAGVYGADGPGAVDALPSLRLRKRERHEVLWRVWRIAVDQLAGCGFENAAGMKFCGECGKPLSGASKPGRPTPDPRSYTPKHLADKILTSRSALEGERKQVTVLFADVKGSMDLAEQVDPEEWHKIMDRFFAILSLPLAGPRPIRGPRRPRAAGGLRARAGGDALGLSQFIRDKRSTTMLGSSCFAGKENEIRDVTIVAPVARNQGKALDQSRCRNQSIFFG